MKSVLPCILTINGGSSSIRFAVYEAGDTPRRRLDGKIDRIGMSRTTFVVNNSAAKAPVTRRLGAPDHRTAARFLQEWLEAQPAFASVKAVGHRVVHGMKHSQPERVTDKKWIGSFAAALGGLDTLVFAAGIGENSPVIRERICEGLGFLGVGLSRKRNEKNAPVISTDAGRVKVRVIRTDEERMIARSVARVFDVGSMQEF